MCNKDFTAVSEIPVFHFIHRVAIVMIRMFVLAINVGIVIRTRIFPLNFVYEFTVKCGHKEAITKQRCATLGKKAKHCSPINFEEFFNKI